jgi:hypothetical protein
VAEAVHAALHPDGVTPAGTPAQQVAGSMEVGEQSTTPAERQS